jgi:hypothetical protein
MYAERNNSGVSARMWSLTFSNGASNVRAVWVHGFTAWCLALYGSKMTSLRGFPMQLCGSLGIPHPVNFEGNTPCRWSYKVLVFVVRVQSTCGCAHEFE